MFVYYKDKQYNLLTSDLIEYDSEKFTIKLWYGTHTELLDFGDKDSFELARRRIVSMLENKICRLH